MGKAGLSCKGSGSRPEFGICIELRLATETRVRIAVACCIRRNEMEWGIKIRCQSFPQDAYPAANSSHLFVSTALMDASY